MIYAKVNGVYTASRVRSGRTDKGQWELIAITDDEGHCSIAVFVENKPSGVKEGGRFRLEEIDNVTAKHRKDDRTKSWWTDVSLTAAVTPIVIVEKETKTDEVSPAVMNYNAHLKEDDCTEADLPF